MYKFEAKYVPARIAELAAKYMTTPYRGATVADADDRMEKAGRRLVAGPVTVADLEIVVDWKSPRRMDRFRLNHPDQLEGAIKEAIEATNAGEERRAVKALTKLAGVGVKMASAILTALFPTLYTVCDFRASHALGQKDFSSLRYYIEYLAACRAIAAQNGVSLRDFDRANWQWSKEQSKKKTKRFDECRWKVIPQYISEIRE